MSVYREPPAWRLPEGVDAPLWQYTHTPRLAAEEDAYFAEHPLFRADARALDERFVTPGRLVDLGCGAGRHAIHFARRGENVISHSPIERFEAIRQRNPLPPIPGRSTGSQRPRSGRSSPCCRPAT